MRLIQFIILLYCITNIYYRLVLVAAYFIHCSYSITEAVITVVRAPDDWYQHPKHVELPTEIY